MACTHGSIWRSSYKQLIALEREPIVLWAQTVARVPGWTTAQRPHLGSLCHEGDVEISAQLSASFWKRLSPQTGDPLTWQRVKTKEPSNLMRGSLFPHGKRHSGNCWHTGRTVRPEIRVAIPHAGRGTPAPVFLRPHLDWVCVELNLIVHSLAFMEMHMNYCWPFVFPQRIHLSLFCMHTSA